MFRALEVVQLDSKLMLNRVKKISYWQVSENFDR